MQKDLQDALNLFLDVLQCHCTGLKVRSPPCCEGSLFAFALSPDLSVRLGFNLLRIQCYLLSAESTKLNHSYGTVN